MVGITNSSTSLIIVSYPWNLEVYLHNPKVWDGCTPIPSSSNNWPKGWICRVSSLQNWALMLNTWAPELIKAVTSCLSIITGASLECPTRCAMRSGLRNGIGATCCHAFLLSAFMRVSFGLESGRECCEFIGCSWQGVWLHSLGSPCPCLMALLELHTPLAIWPQPWHLKHCRALGSFLFWALPWAHVDAWALSLLQEAVATLLAAEDLWAEVLWSRQSNHCGSCDGQEYSCLSALSHDPCAWKYLEC